MNDERPDTDRPDVGDEPRAEASSADRRSKRVKIAIGVGVAAAVWVVALVIKGSGESEADGGRDAVGRPKTGIDVAEPDEPQRADSDDSDSEAEGKTHGQWLNELDQLDATVWAKEIQAQRYEAAVVKLWDDLRAADDKLAVFEAAAPPTVMLGSLGRPEEVGAGVRVIEVSPPGKPRTADEFRGLLASFRRMGYVVEQTEWRLVEFVPAEAIASARSTVAVVIDAHGPDQRRRVSIRGELAVVWSNERDDAGHPRAESVDASRLTLVVRDAPPAFVEVLRFETEPPQVLRTLGRLRRIWPVLLDDLDGDGLPELILAGRNLVYPNLGEGKFGQPRQFCPRLPPIAPAAVLADFTGDGVRDFVCFDGAGRLWLYRGDGRGRFAEGEIGGEFALRLPTAAAAGDIDGDGDLDLFVGQYKKPFDDGQMPTPYYDANDGEPAYLLRNDGGRFADITEPAGLAAKRHRRTHAASLADLDGDGHLDLLVSSDFAGVDLYRGDGAGRLEDVTATLLGERHGLSAAHALADFDGDGRLDFFVGNESAHVVRRLDRLGIGRTDMPDATKMRTATGYGNRMYLARDGRFEPPSLAETLAATGRPRSCAALDVDNDGRVDLFLATGQQSGESAADVASNFWRHAIYIGSSQPDVALKLVFKDLFLEPLGSRAASQNGFQHNVLLANRGEKGFLDVAYALGAASQVDAPATLAADIDNDGRVDLLILEIKIEEKLPRETLYVLRNTLDAGGHWVGVRLHNSPSGRSPIGARVTLTAGGKRQTAVVATGQSQGVQGGPVVHFGLATATAVDKLEIRWPDGKADVLNRPAVDRYHEVGRGTSAESAAAASR